MSENVQSAMLEILKRIQSDVSDVKQRLERVEQRLERVEGIVLTQRRDSAAMLVMMRATVGVYDQRLTHAEEDIRLVKEHIGLT